MITIESYKADTHLSFMSDTTHDDVDAIINPIKEDVLSKKDLAILAYTKKFDAPSAPPSFSLRLTETEIHNAYNHVSDDYLTAIKEAIENIQAFHEHQRPKNWFTTNKKGYAYGMQYSPINIAGLYVPGGRALYPSSVLMNAIPAKIAGVPTLVMCTPPQSDGTIAPELAVAAAECNIDIVIKAGGAQAVYGMAYGTESIPKVDKIVGPGNQYVDRAKQSVYGIVDIDKPAGPSEVLVYVEDPHYARFAASELLTQCEHDPSASGIVLSSSKETLQAVQSALSQQLPTLNRQPIIKEALKNSHLYLVDSQEKAIKAINDIASEHVCLIIDDAETIAAQITYAGAIFCGPYTPVALGDYIAGPNHVLPTARAARFSSALSVMDFMRFSSLLSCNKQTLEYFKPFVKSLTSVEKLDAHYQSVNHRLEN